MVIDALVPFYRWAAYYFVHGMDGGGFLSAAAVCVSLPGRAGEFGECAVQGDGTAVVEADYCAVDDCDMGVWDSFDFDAGGGELACGVVVDEIRFGDFDERVYRRVF